MTVARLPVPVGYPAWLTDLKIKIRDARLRKALAVNSELIMLYWQIGREILNRQDRDGWGTKVVDRLSIDLRAEFPESRGFSSANLRYMRAFAEACPDPAICQRVVGKLPWGQNIELLSVKDRAARLWYAEATLEQGWSRPVLVFQIDTKAHARQGQALTNFGRTLPPETSDLAQQILKAPYHFDFLTVSQPLQERDVEQGLITRVKDLLLELGKGFSFIANQHHLEVGGQDFYADLLSYHRKLRCLIAVDLKAGPFRPEHAGKMNFYLAALDDLEREPGDNPSIGLILCRERNRVIVEYALRGVETPIGVSRYQLMLAEALPAELTAALPSSDDLEPGILAAAGGNDDPA
jgi:predicted nuclease of restriction endonuclease-like (RecB) superfamily